MTKTTNNKTNTLKLHPNANGHFGKFGGRYVAETLMHLILSVEKAYEEAKEDPSFRSELD